MRQTVYKHSAGGVVIHNNKVLVITSAIRSSIGLPKGTIETGEVLEAAAIREVKEETGYDTEIIQKIGDYTFEFDWSDGMHHAKTVTYFLMRLLNDRPPEPQLQPGEDFKSSWLSFDEALDVLTYEDSKDAVRLAIGLISDMS